MNNQFLREINHDLKTPKNQKKLNEDGFFEATDEECCSGDCECKKNQITLTE